MPAGRARGRFMYDATLKVGEGHRAFSKGRFIGGGALRHLPKKRRSTGAKTIDK